ncbi:MAG TPA: peptidase M50 [Clostridia bacterium]|nr:peptidase M50 [Clostridia bacterium]
MKLGKIGGIRLIINDYFLLLLLGYALLGVLQQVLIIFGVVFFHEMAHVLAARRYGIRVREVEIFPFGGVARMEQMLELEPAVEIRVALAGPLSNFFLFFLSLWFFPGIIGSSLGKLFLQVNLTLAIFNLLPAFPLDGGRIIRSLVAGRLGLSRANLMAIRWGKGIAVGIGFLGLLGLYWRISDINPVVLAIFLYGVACREEANCHYFFLRYLLRKREELALKQVLPVRHFLARNQTALGDVVTRFAPGFYHLVVIEGGPEEPVTLTEYRIISALLEHGREYPIGKLVS